MKHETKNDIKFFCALFLLFIGIVLYFVSIYLPPVGVIDASVLGATGELFSVSGALLGIGAYTRIKIHEIDTRAKMHKNGNDYEGD